MRKFLKQKRNVLWEVKTSEAQDEERLEMTYSGNNKISLKRSLHQDRTWSNRRPVYQSKVVTHSVQGPQFNGQRAKVVDWKVLQLKQL